MGILGQTFHTDQKMRNEISHILIPMSSQWATVGKWFQNFHYEKMNKSRKLRGLKLLGLRRNQMSTPYFIYQNRIPRELDQKFGILRIGTIH